MINIGGNPLMILLAIAAALGGVGLYFVRNFRPELARDHDIFFSAIALVYGIILLAFNFRMEVTTQLAQVLLVGFAGWFAVETLSLRSSLSRQARRTPMEPMADDPVRPDYRVELDPSREFYPRREPSTRRMRGSDPYSDRPSELRGDVDSERRTRRPRRSGDTVIDIDEDDIRPVRPRRSRPPEGTPNDDRPEGRTEGRDRRPDIPPEDRNERPRPDRRSDTRRPSSPSEYSEGTEGSEPTPRRRPRRPPSLDADIDADIRDRGEREDY